MTLLQRSSILTLNGIELAVDPAAMSPHMIEVIKAGHYEGGEAREIARIVQPGERVLELGAGIGYISIATLKTGHVQRHVAFEANPRLIPLIRRNAELNKVEIDVRNEIVLPDPQAASVPFYVRQDFWASSMSPQPFGYVEQIDVPAVSFDEMRERVRPTMLIVDIEGGEEHLFRPGVSLTGIKKIYVELHQRVIGRIGMKNVFDFMSSKDFHYDQHHSRGGVVLFSHVLR